MRQPERETEARSEGADSPPTVFRDWLAVGQSMTVQIGGVEITLRLVDRKGRRARIAVSAGRDKGGSK
jgi:hypothetical protein